VFGGASRRVPAVTVRPAPAAAGASSCAENGRTLRHVGARRARTWRVAASGLPRGAHRIRLVARAAHGRALRATLGARRL
jgi:hypothetical protein